MNKSIGLLKTLMKNNFIKHQTIEVNHSSNRYSPSKPRKHFYSKNKSNRPNFNFNIERKKNIYQQSFQAFKKLDKNDKLKSFQNKNSLDFSHFYKNDILNGNNIPNNLKISQNNSKIINNSKTINDSKNKSYDLNKTLQKKIGSKSYVDLFKNNIYNSNDHINLGNGRTISNCLHEKLFDFENNMNNNINMNKSNEHFYHISDMNNIINILINYINIIKEEYEKIIINKLHNKDIEIKKLQNEIDFLIKENKKLKYKIMEIFYCAKKYEDDKYNNNDKFYFSIKQLIEENKYLRNNINITNTINKAYYYQLQNNIYNNLIYKETLIHEKKEEEKNNQNINNDNNNNKDNEYKSEMDNNPFKSLNNNHSNHKRQKTQFKIGILEKNENNNKMNADEADMGHNDILDVYLNKMKNSILVNKDKNGSQKNILTNRNNKTKQKNNEENNGKTNDENKDNNLSMSSSNDSIIYNKDNANKNNDENIYKDKESSFKKIKELNYFPCDEKYSKRIEFTK